MGLFQRKQYSAVATEEVDVLPSYGTFTTPLSAGSGRDPSYYQFTTQAFSALSSYSPVATEADGFRTALAVAAAIGRIKRGEYAEALDVLRKIQQLPSPNGAAELCGDWPVVAQKPDPFSVAPAMRKP